MRTLLLLPPPPLLLLLPLLGSQLYAFFWAAYRLGRAGTGEVARALCRKGVAGFIRKPACYLGEGGSIPFMGMLGKMFPEAQFLITGVVGPSANAHGPNEFLHVGYAKKLTGCVASVGAPVVTASCLWLHTYLRLCPAC